MARLERTRGEAPVNQPDKGEGTSRAGARPEAIAPSGGREAPKRKVDEAAKEPSARPTTPAELRQERPSKRQERLAHEREEAEKDDKSARGYNDGNVKAAAGGGSGGNAEHSQVEF